MSIPNIAPPNLNGKTRILVPGGIGDVYWIMVKMESFCKREGIKGKPEIILLSPKMWDSADNRAIPFLEMIPFIEISDPSVQPMIPEGTSHIFKLQKFYSKLSTTFDTRVIPGFMGYDYFICYNGIINTGHNLEDIDPELKCNWDLPLKISKEQQNYQAECKSKYGRYAVFYFSLKGDFVTKNMTQFSIDKMAEGINVFTTQFELTPVFIGAWWDIAYPQEGIVNYLPDLISKIPNAVNIVGETSLEQAFGVMRGAELVSGYHCGLTNMAIMFKKKTVLLWAPDRFPSGTALAVAPPDTRMTSYIPLYTQDLTVEEYAETMGVLYEK